VPRLRALYLAAVAIGVFFVPGVIAVGAIAAAQLILLVALGAGAGELWRTLRKLLVFLAVIFIAYSLVEGDPGTAEWHTYELLWWEIDINHAGALVGLIMVLRVVAVVLASNVARAGDPRALAAGLGKLGVPRKAALAIDATLALLGGVDRGKGKGGGGGGGGGRGGGGGTRRERLRRFWRRLKKLGRGDVSALTEPLAEHIARVEDYVAENAPDLSRQIARDVAIIAGIALTMLGIKMLKLLPGLPFAPGHKGVLLIPLYFAAAGLAKSRFSGTLTGLTMGTAAFLLGDGRWGVFEIAKHIAPGLLADLLMPILIREPARASVLAWCALGTLCALGRFATVTAIALTVQAPALVFAFLIPGLLIHAVFGALSGIVTAPLMRALQKERIDHEQTGDR
jgi:hypothetical protein